LSELNLVEKTCQFFRQPYLSDLFNATSYTVLLAGSAASNGLMTCPHTV